MNKIIDFLKSSYDSDKTAFYLELISFVFTVGASLMLALNADQPDMRIVYPGFFVGSLTAIIAYKRRKIVWRYLLIMYFAFVNVLRFEKAMGWW